jgi:hypothetical protein
MNELFSFHYCFNFFKIHRNFISFNDHFEKFRFCCMKLAFVDVCLNICFAQSLKNFAHVLYVFFFAVTVNDNVVQICNDEFVEIIHQRIIHKILKSRRFVDQFERHHQIFIHVVFDSECDQILVLFEVHANSVKCMTNVYFNHSLRFRQVSDCLNNKKNWISILFRDCI